MFGQVTYSIVLDPRINQYNYANDPCMLLLNITIS